MGYYTKSHEQTQIFSLASNNSLHSVGPDVGPVWKGYQQTTNVAVSKGSVKKA